jgi:putative CocE/NonD family hydrolase
MRIGKIGRGFFGIIGLLSFTLFSCAPREGLGEFQTDNSAFEDSGSFKLFLKGTVVATATNSLDRDGNYRRKMVMSMAGQTAEYQMSVTPDENGLWRRMEIVNPAFGTIDVKREGDRAIYRMKGEEKNIKLPDGYVLYDDYGMIYESLMLRKYDMGKGGKQVFKRFRIPESFPGDVIDVEVDYLDRETRLVDNTNWMFLKFRVNTFGVVSVYWVDRDFKIYMTETKAVQATGIREGFEELMFPAEVDPLLSKPEFEVIEKTVMMPMRDGVKLSTDLYFPSVQEGKFPCILIRTPYKKESSELDGKFYARRGYAVAIQDVRGRYASEGEWEPFVHEGEDGYDAVEWLAAQPWSNGKVGMVGGSYLGWVQFWAAVQKPPHLATIIPNVVPPDPFYNFPYEYGSFFILAALWWAEMVEKEAASDMTMKKFFEIGSRDYEKDLDHLPVIDIDLNIFGKKNHYWREWVKHNVNDSYWERANYLDKLKDLDIPVFLQSGWLDGDTMGSKLAYLRLKESNSQYIKLILGPWGHSDLAINLSGRDLGEEGAVDLPVLYLRWFDFWLKGIENTILEEPLVELYAMNSKKWLKADTYPLPQTKLTKLYLSSSKGANTLKGDGKLVWKIPEGGKEYDVYTYDPEDPTPAWQFRAAKGGKKRYEEITSKRHDILVFETEPFEQPLTIAGPMSAKLYAASSAVDTDWFITIIAFSDDQGPIPLGNPWGRGTIRARFRNSLSEPELLDPDRIYEYTIDLWHTGITLEKGWRLRVEVTSAFFPFFSRNLNTGGHNEMETDFVKAEQKIYHSREYPSHILLPVVDLDQSIISIREASPGKQASESKPPQSTGRAIKEAPQKDVKPEILDAYVGEYQLRPDFRLTVTAEGGKLMAQPSGQSSEQLYPQSETAFLSKKINAELVFIKDENGRVSHILLHQGGYKIQVRNTAYPWPEPKKEHKEIQIDPNVSDVYAGSYELAPNQIFTITRENDSLFAQLTGQPKIKVFPESEATFFYKVVDAQITFVRDKEGNVSHLVIHQNNMYMQADRS